MTKDILIALKGIRFEGGGEDVEEMEVFTPGEYFFRNDTHYLLYEETDEDGNETSSRIKIKKDVVELTKKGEVNVHMIFETGKKNLTNYQTAYGTLAIGLYTHDISFTQEKDCLHLKINYQLEINYMPMAECEISLDVASKEKGSALFRS